MAILTIKTLSLGMNIKNIIISFYFCFLFSQQSVDGVLAVVGENIITQNDFFQQLSTVANQRGVSPSAHPLKYELLAERVLDNIINQYVVLDFAEKDSTILVSSDEVKAQLEEQISYFIRELGSVSALEDVFQMK